MNKNILKIKTGLECLADKPFEVISGTMVPGSLNSAEYTISVQPNDDSRPIEGVTLNTVTNNINGIILYPADGSDVIIASIDGPGEWSLLKASELRKIRLTIGNVIISASDAEVSIVNSNVAFNVRNDVFRMNTASESLYALLKDCFTYITALTVPTPSGTSSTPVNIADFNNLITRLDNLLTS